MASKRLPEPNDFREGLKSIHAVFEAAGIRWWIQDGTALGAVRGGGPIPGDNDIDIGMQGADFAWSLVDDFAHAGMPILRVRGEPGRMMLRFNGPVPFDLFLMYPFENRWAYCFPADDFTGRAVVTPFGVRTINFLGVEVPCPDPVERYLEESYGPTWRTPISRWHFMYSPPNISIDASFRQKLIYRYREAKWHANSLMISARRAVGRATRREGAPAT